MTIDSMESSGSVHKSWLPSMVKVTVKVTSSCCGASSRQSTLKSMSLRISRGITQKYLPLKYMSTLRISRGITQKYLPLKYMSTLRTSRGITQKYLPLKYMSTLLLLLGCGGLILIVVVAWCWWWWWWCNCHCCSCIVEVLILASVANMASYKSNVYFYNVSTLIIKHHFYAISI